MEDTNLFINMTFFLKLYYGDAHTCSATKDAVLPLKISASGTVGTGLCQGRFVLNYHQLRGSTILWLVCVEVGESRRERWREHSWQLMLVGQMRLSSGSVLMRCSAKVHEQRERPLRYLETTHRNVLTHTHRWKMTLPLDTDADTLTKTHLHSCSKQNYCTYNIHSFVYTHIHRQVITASMRWRV